MLTKRDVILFKLQSVVGTPVVPSASTDAVLIENPTWSHEGLRMIDRPGVRSSLGTPQKIFGGTLKAVSFDLQVKGSGTAGAAPEFGPILQCAGMSETIVASTSVTYKNTSTASSHKVGTMYYYQDGMLHQMTDCRVNAFAFSAPVGEYAKLSVTVVGHDASLTDSAIVTPTLDSTKPQPFIGATFSAHSYAAKISSLSFNLGLTVAMQPDANATDGYGEIVITGRDVTGSFDPAAQLVATHDFVGRFKAGTTGTISTGVIGATAGNRWAVTLSESYYLDVKPGDRSGIRTFDVPFACTDESTTDNEVAIAFT